MKTLTTLPAMTTTSPAEPSSPSVSAYWPLFITRKSQSFLLCTCVLITPNRAQAALLAVRT